MTPQELKNSILQLAIQGKLVEQRPEEGTGEELYQEIQKEKQALIKAGKIKKEKPLPDIAEDEVPFEIPESWMWVKFGNVISLLSGTDFKPEEYNDQHRGVPYITGASNLSKTGILINRWTKVPRMITEYGDVLLVCKGSGYGKTIICDVDKAHIARQIMAIKRMQSLDMSYIMFYVKANIKSIKANGQGVIPGIDRGSVLQMQFPLPPLPEQKRIVAKIEELLPLIDRYEKAWTRLEDFNKRFPTDMQKSILQMAIQGKLVEQRPEEGTGEELYQRIQEEKQALVKAGKIKKQKPLPEITEDEVPFEIPETWRWVRLGILTEMITSGSRDWAQYYSDSGDIFLRMGNLSRDSFELRLDKIQHVTLPEHTEGQRTSLQSGDLLFSITGEVGTLGLIPDEFGKAYINQHTAMIRFLQRERNKYIPFLLLTDYAHKYYNGNKHGIKNSFRLDSISLMPVPLPPLIEQQRIVAKLEEVLPLCEGLKEN